MLPVSGAEQLNASEAHGTRPINSASGAYSTLVNPAPRSDCGKKRFHNCTERAFSFNRSISASGVQRAPRPVFSAISSA